MCLLALAAAKTPVLKYDYTDRRSFAVSARPFIGCFRKIDRRHLSVSITSLINGLLQ